jgi:multisubunit Na+/H+ antiporter MnhB subunit
MSEYSSTIGDTTVYVGNHWIPFGDPYGPKAAELTVELDITNTARREGVANLPASTDRDLDECQRRVLSAGDTGTATLLAIGETKIRAAENEIERLSPRPFNAALEEADIHRAIADEKQRCESALDEKHQARQSAWRQRELFKLENGLTRSAVYGTDIAVFTLTLLAFAILEAVGNASIFQQATEGGLTGGFLLAIAVGLVNIALGCAVGFFGRGIVHTDRRRRADGWIVIGVGVFAAFTMHLVLAHFREALEHTTTEAPPIDFSIVLKPATWFSFTGLEPFLLFTAGIIFFAVAAMKGRGGRWGICDGYTPAQRKRRYGHKN